MTELWSSWLVFSKLVIHPTLLEKSKRSLVWYLIIFDFPFLLKIALFSEKCIFAAVLSNLQKLQNQYNWIFACRIQSCNAYSLHVLHLKFFVVYLYCSKQKDLTTTTYLQLLSLHIVLIQCTIFIAKVCETILHIMIEYSAVNVWENTSTLRYLYCIVV